MEERDPSVDSITVIYASSTTDNIIKFINITILFVKTSNTMHKIISFKHHNNSQTTNPIKPIHGQQHKPSCIIMPMLYICRVNLSKLKKQGKAFLIFSCQAKRFFLFPDKKSGVGNSCCQPGRTVQWQPVPQGYQIGWFRAAHPCFADCPLCPRSSAG